MATNEITSKMSERTQVNAANVEVPLLVMMKDPRKLKRVRDYLSSIIEGKKSWPRRLKLRRMNLILVTTLGHS